MTTAKPANDTEREEAVALLAQAEEIYEESLSYARAQRQACAKRERVLKLAEAAREWAAKALEELG